MYRNKPTFDCNSHRKMFGRIFPREIAYAHPNDIWTSTLCRTPCKWTFSFQPLCAATYGHWDRPFAEISLHRLHIYRRTKIGNFGMKNAVFVEFTVNFLFKPIQIRTTTIRFGVSEIFIWKLKTHGKKFRHIIMPILCQLILISMLSIVHSNRFD